MPKKKLEKPPKLPVVVSLTVNGQNLTSEGNTLEEAFLGLKLDKANTKGLVSYEIDGKKSKEIVIPIPRIKRLFFQGMSGDVERTVLVKKIRLLSGL